MDTLATVSDIQKLDTEPLFEAYIASLDLKPRSKQEYSKAVSYFLNYCKDNGILHPQREDIIAYKQALTARYSACTVNSYLVAARSFFMYLEAKGLYPNITAGIKGTKQQQDFKKDALTLEQAQALLSGVDTSTLKGKRDLAIVNLTIHTGLRTIEIQRADIGDIRSNGGKPCLYVQGKGRDSKDNFVKLPQQALEPVEAYLKARGITAETAPLFAGVSNRDGGQRMTTRSISRICKGALQGAGMDSKRLTAHSLRHTAVTFSLLAGATPQEAQAMARHSNISTTMIYSHNINRLEHAAEDRIAAFLAGEPTNRAVA